MRELQSETHELRQRRGELGNQLAHIELATAETKRRLEELAARLAQQSVQRVEELPPHEEVKHRLAGTEERLRAMGPVNQRAVADYAEWEGRRNETKRKRDTLEHESAEIAERIEKCEQMKRDAFFDAFNAVNRNFKEIFAELSDGRGELELEDAEKPFDGGMRIRAQPAGKGVLELMSRSGGEKSLVSLSLILAIQRYRPAPFYALDEVDMNLDAINVERVARMFRRASKEAQFIVVTLRQPMIEAADRVIGVAMQESDISTVTGVRLEVAAAQ